MKKYIVGQSIEGSVVDSFLLFKDENMAKYVCQRLNEEFFEGKLQELIDFYSSYGMTEEEIIAVNNGFLLKELEEIDDYQDTEKIIREASCTFLF